jgi:hypothetical protein
VLAELPVGDEPLEALDFVALEGQERRHEELAEHGPELVAGLHRSASPWSGAAPGDVARLCRDVIRRVDGMLR